MHAADASEDTNTTVKASVSKSADGARYPTVMEAALHAHHPKFQIIMG